MKNVFVCSINTGEIIKDFTPMEVFMGKQYWGAWCVGHFYTIVNEETDGETYTYWVK